MNPDDYLIHAGTDTVSMWCLICNDSIDHPEPQQWPDGTIRPMTITLDTISTRVTLTDLSKIANDHHASHHQ